MRSWGGGLLEGQNDGVKVVGSGEVQDERVHGGAQVAEDTPDGGVASAMAGAAGDRGLGGSAAAAGYIERWSEGERHGGVEDEAVHGSAEAARQAVLE
jgi:hypothetical protein